MMTASSKEIATAPYVTASDADYIPPVIIVDIMRQLI